MIHHLFVASMENKKKRGFSTYFHIACLTWLSSLPNQQKTRKSLGIPNTCFTIEIAETV